MVRRPCLSFLLGLFVLAGSQVYASQVTSLQCTDPGSTTASSSAVYVNANSCTDFSYPLTTQSMNATLNNWQYGYYTYNGGTPLLDPTSFALMSSTQKYDTMGNVVVGQNTGWWSQNFNQYWTALDAFEGHSNATYTDLHQPPYCDAVLGTCGSGPAPGGSNSVDSGNYFATRRYVVPDYAGSVTLTLQGEKDPGTAVPTAESVTDYVLLVSGSNVTMEGCINVYAQATPDPNETYPTCSGTTTSNDMITSQSIYSMTTNFNVAPGDYIDIVMLPDYNDTVSNYADYSSGSFELVTISGSPEPATFGVIAVGLGLLGFLRRKITPRG